MAKPRVADWQRMPDGIDGLGPLPAKSVHVWANLLMGLADTIRRHFHGLASRETRGLTGGSASHGMQTGRFGLYFRPPGVR
jgi:hypothetical protein